MECAQKRELLDLMLTKQIRNLMERETTRHRVCGRQEKEPISAIVGSGHTYCRNHQSELHGERKKEVGRQEVERCIPKAKALNIIPAQYLYLSASYGSQRERARSFKERGG